MRRLLLAGALALAAFGPVAAADPLGNCDGKVDVACQTGYCDPERGCQIRICVVWTGARCLV